jgi:hypothetical protein
VNCSAAHAWLSGQNPYDPPAIARWWREHAGGLHFTADIHGLPVVNAPTALVVTAPFALFPPGIAGMLWIGVSLILLVLQMTALLDMAGLRKTEPRGMLLAAAVLISVPLTLGVLTGQAAVMAVSLLVLAAHAAMKGRHVTGGILLGLSAALKFQIALPFVMLYFILGRSRVACWGLGIFLGILLIALAGLQLGGTPWLSSWAAALHEVSRPGGLNDFAAGNSDRHQLLNLQMIFSGFLSDRLLINALSLSAASALALVLLFYIRVHQPGSDELLILAIASAICLLPIYHRIYDAVLLTIAATWAVKHLNDARPAIPRLVAAILVVCFMLPPVSFGKQPLIHGLLPLQSFRAVALLALAILLICQAGRTRHPGVAFPV